jgi:organic radical activating enzyme
MSLRTANRNTDLEIKHYIDSHSPTLCLAKWYNATIWLGSGMTTSCHHPLPHFVHLHDITKTPKALHNTPEKKEDRRKMQEGKRPTGCEYCWKIEDIGRDSISDRVYKTAIYNDEDVKTAMATDSNEDIDLKTLEIAFDRTCQFACSYCNPAFSTQWVTDLKKNGPYTDLISDGRNHYTHEHTSSQRYKPNETNPYVEAFFNWWESDLHRTLSELRLTGGEPLMSSHTWRLLDWYNKNDTDVAFALNSNLGVDENTITKLIEATKNIPDFQLYTSNESTSEHAEYIRDGFNWDQWSWNIERLLTEGNIKGFHMMCTINALCLETLPEFLDYCIELKGKFGKSFPTFTLNILRFPSFQGPLILPDRIRMKFKDNMQHWLDENKNNILLHEMELNQVQRLIDYLDVVKTPHSDTFDMPSLLHDFKHFYKQYDTRRDKNFTETFDALGQWYQGL